MKPKKKEERSSIQTELRFLLSLIFPPPAAFSLCSDCARLLPSWFFSSPSLPSSLPTQTDYRTWCSSYAKRHHVEALKIADNFFFLWK